jgi:hypothetical protein
MTALGIRSSYVAEGSDSYETLAVQRSTAHRPQTWQQLECWTCLVMAANIELQCNIYCLLS